MLLKSRRLFHLDLFTTVKFVIYMMVEAGKGRANSVKLRQIWIIASSIGLGIATIPLALSMITQELWIPYIAWKVWLFGVAPLVFLYLLRSERRNQ